MGTASELLTGRPARYVVTCPWDLDIVRLGPRCSHCLSFPRGGVSLDRCTLCPVSENNCLRKPGVPAQQPCSLIGHLVGGPLAASGTVIGRLQTAASLHGLRCDAVGALLRIPPFSVVANVVSLSALCPRFACPPPTLMAPAVWRQLLAAHWQGAWQCAICTV